MPRLGRKKIKALLEEHLNYSSCHYGIGGENPMLLVIEDRVFTIFLKPIGDVCYENENESTRVQLPKRDYFDKMKVSKRPFLLMGFDLENNVFVVWNPSNTKERLNTKKNLSFYCRLSAQREANKKQQPVRCNLTNGEFVWVVPMTFIAEFLMHIEDYFVLPDVYDYKITEGENYSIVDECQGLFSVDVNDVIEENGKVVAIKNPAILKELKVARSSGKPFAEYDVLYKYYENKKSIMTLSEWAQLLNAIKINEENES